MQEDTSAAAAAEQLVAEVAKEAVKAAAKKAKKQKAKTRKQQAQSQATAAAALAGSIDRESSLVALRQGAAEQGLIGTMGDLDISQHRADQTSAVQDLAAAQPQPQCWHGNGVHEKGFGPGTDEGPNGDADFLNQLFCCPVTKVRNTQHMQLACRKSLTRCNNLFLPGNSNCMLSVAISRPGWSCNGPLSGCQ